MTVVDATVPGPGTAPNNTPQQTTPATRPSTTPQNPVPTEVRYAIAHGMHPHSLVNNQQFPAEFPNERVYTGPTSGVDIPSPPSSLRPLQPPHNLTSYIRPQSVSHLPGPRPSSYPCSQPYTGHHGHPITNQTVHSPTTNVPVHLQDRLVPNVQNVHTEPTPIRSRGPALNTPVRINHHPTPGSLTGNFSTPIHPSVDHRHASPRPSHLRNTTPGELVNTQTPNQQESRHPVHAATPPPGPPPYHPGPRFAPHSVHPGISIQRIPSPAQPDLPPPHQVSEKAPLIDTVEDLSDDDVSVVSSCVEDSQSDVVEHGGPSTLVYLESLNLSNCFPGVNDPEITVAN